MGSNANELFYILIMFSRTLNLLVYVNQEGTEYAKSNSYQVSYEIQ